jgi:hypothetical protein
VPPGLVGGVVDTLRGVGVGCLHGCVALVRHPGRGATERPLEVDAGLGVGHTSVVLSMAAATISPLVRREPVEGHAVPVEDDGGEPVGPVGEVTGLGPAGLDGDRLPPLQAEPERATADPEDVVRRLGNEFGPRLGLVVRGREDAADADGVGAVEALDFAGAREPEARVEGGPTDGGRSATVAVRRSASFAVAPPVSGAKR